ncbi:hypothetical protein B0H17DRAFT_1140347 [Mycena rosella]|uniref:Uncharacterized protein n=1 Tax=Mycena rosella TaxID=1033263 RepID=A0AAD7D2J3_MYCRO|nr:hypothetical protein B0H17DRAFT_1140347 [Mycena rosella]
MVAGRQASGSTDKRENRDKRTPTVAALQLIAVLVLLLALGLLQIRLRPGLGLELGCSGLALALAAAFRPSCPSVIICLTHALNNGRAAFGQPQCVGPQSGDLRRRVSAVSWCMEREEREGRRVRQHTQIAEKKVKDTSFVCAIKVSVAVLVLVTADGCTEKRKRGAKKGTERRGRGQKPENKKVRWQNACIAAPDLPLLQTFARSTPPAVDGYWSTYYFLLAEPGHLTHIDSMGDLYMLKPAPMLDRTHAPAPPSHRHAAHVHNHNQKLSMRRCGGQVEHGEQRGEDGEEGQLDNSHPESPVRYTHGFNLRAIAAFVLALVPNLLGLAAKINNKHSPAAQYIFSVFRLVGIVLAATCYLLFNLLWPVTVTFRHQQAQDGTESINNDKDPEKVMEK